MEMACFTRQIRLIPQEALSEGVSPFFKRERELHDTTTRIEGTWGYLAYRRERENGLLIEYEVYGSFYVRYLRLYTYIHLPNHILPASLNSQPKLKGLQLNLDPHIPQPRPK